MKVFYIFLLFIPLHISAQKSELLLFQEKVHDFGEINESEGKVEHEFTFVNNTARPIKILSVDTSCGCTTTGYSKGEIKQGKNGFIKVSFDPKGRPGYFNKSISASTDYGSESIVLQIKGQVNSGESKDPMMELTTKNGNLRMKHSSFSFSKVFINREPIEKEFAVLNTGERPIQFISKTSTPDYISVTLPEIIQPKQKAFIKIKYDARMRNQYGFYSDLIEIQTNDELQPTKVFSVYATIEEYFMPLSEMDKLKAPFLQLGETTVSLGRIISDAEMQREVTFKNLGKLDLTVRSLQSNCACILASTANKTIKSGEEGKLRVIFNPKGRIGQQNKSIAIYSTDPTNSVQRITVTGYIPD
jgi:hypothetical protein